MKKKIALLLLICLTAITSWAGSTNEAVENLNRRLPIESGTDRLLAKMIYDEVNNIVVANYYTTWQNLVQMRKTPDFGKRTAAELLNIIFLEDINVKPFTLIVNYFADEAGFEDLAKTYFISPGQVANAQKALQNSQKNKKKDQTVAQTPVTNSPQQSLQPQQPQGDQELLTLASILAEFKGYTEPQGRFHIARYALSKDLKDITIVILANEEALPFFTEEQYIPTMEASMCSRLAKQYPQLENIFNTKELNVIVYTADNKGTIKGQHKFPASKVFANKQKETAPQDVKDNDKKKGKDKDKDKSKNKKDKKNKDKSRSNETTSAETVAQVGIIAPAQTSTPSQTSQTPSQTATPSQTQTPEQQQQQSTAQQVPTQQQPSAQQAPAKEQTQGSQTKSNKNATPEDNFQALIKLYQALLPQKIDDGVKLTQIKANKEAVMLLIEVDSEKYPESSAPQVRELLIKHLATEFSKKKSIYPLLLTLSCQTNRQYIYVVGSKAWTNTYPVPLQPCSIIDTLVSKVKK